MTASLTAKRHSLVPRLVLISTDAATFDEGNVVARANTDTGQVWRTNYTGPEKPTMAAIRAAFATIA